MYKKILLITILLPILSLIPIVIAQNESPVITADNIDQLERIAIVGFGEMYDIAYSPDGAFIAVGGSRGIWVFDANDITAPPRLLQGHTDNVYSVTFSPDSTMIASGSQDTTVRLWDVVSGENIRVLEGHEDYIPNLSFSPDGDYLVSTSSDIRIWEVATGNTTLIIDENPIGIFTFSNDGSALIGSPVILSSTPKLFDIESGELIGNFTERVMNSDHMAISPDETLIASYNARSVTLFDVASAERIAVFEGHTSGINDLEFSPDGTLLASASNDETIRIWDVVSGETISVLEGYAGNPFLYHTMTFSPDGAKIASVGTDGLLRLWDVASGQTLAVAGGHSGSIHELAFSPDGSLLATSSNDKTIILWDTTTWQPVDRLLGHTSDTVQSLRFSPDGTTLASSQSGEIFLWDVATGEILRTIEIPQRNSRESTFSDDISLFALTTRNAYTDSRTQVWNIATEEMIFEFEGHRGTIKSIAFSPDQTLLATGSQDETTRLWNVETGENIFVFDHHSGRDQGVTGLTFSPDGTILAVQTLNDPEIFLWDVSSEEISETPFRIIDEPRLTVANISFSPDSTLFFALTGNSIWAWDTADWTVIREIEENAEDTRNMAFSPDGTTLVTSLFETAIMYVWGIPTD